MLACNFVRRYFPRQMVTDPKSSPPPRTNTRSSQPRAVTLRIGLYVLAALAAGGTLFVAPALTAAVGRGALAEMWLRLPLAIYGLFLVVYGVDRFLLVRRRRYPVGKALFQVAFAAIFFLVLPNAIMRVPTTASVTKNTVKKSSAFKPLDDDRPEVRLTYVYSLGYQGMTKERVNTLVVLLNDTDMKVRTASEKVLSDWSGKPIGQISGIRAWASALSETSTVSGKEQNE